MRLFPIFGLALLAACREPSTSPKFDPHAFVGTWTLDVSASPGCWPAFSVAFEIDPEVATGATKDEMTFTTDWWYTATPATTYLVSGDINWPQKTFEAEFTASTDHARFEGSSLTSTRVNGTLYDAEGLFVKDPSCTSSQAAAVARKTLP